MEQESDVTDATAPTFESDIKPLFREADRDAMIAAFDLWSFADVKANADAILGEMPPSAERGSENRIGRAPPACAHAPTPPGRRITGNLSQGEVTAAQGREPGAHGGASRPRDRRGQPRRAACRDRAPASQDR
jgi:hypothetical protein